MLVALLDDFNPQLGLFVATPRRTLRLIDRVFERLNIGQHQLGFNRFDIRNGIDVA